MYMYKCVYTGGLVRKCSKSFLRYYTGELFNDLNFNVNIFLIPITIKTIKNWLIINNTLQIMNFLMN